MAPPNPAAMEERFMACQQGHVLSGLLSSESDSEESREEEEPRRHRLRNQLQNLNLELLARAIDEIHQQTHQNAVEIESSLEPPPSYPKANWKNAREWLADPPSRQVAGDGIRKEENETEKWFHLGLSLIAQNKAAVVVLAGGQGTRLGSAAPPAKGMLDIGLASGKSLFQLQAERIRRVQFLASKAHPQANPEILWIVLTSDATDTVTRSFFEQHKFFGLNPSQVEFVKQSNMPCVNIEKENGVHKLLLDDPHHVAESPDGNGGIFEVFSKYGISKKLQDSGILYVQVYAVDNALIRVADPVFFGYCKEKGAEIGIKVVSKANPKESVGVVCLKSIEPSSNGVSEKDNPKGKRYGVVEYSEMTEKLRNLKDENGNLVYNAAHICINLFSVGFLNRFRDSTALSLPYHAARKKIPFVERNEIGSWQLIHPTVPNGIKFEKFIFDAFVYCHPEEVAILEVERDEEFAPIKNADGKGVPDTPTTARALLLALHRKWVDINPALLKNPSAFPHSPPNPTAVDMEISPLVSYCGESLL